MRFNSIVTPMETNLINLSDSTSDSDLVDPTMYWQLIGSLMYLVNMRLDICFVVSTLSQFMVELRYYYWVVAKHVLMYLHGIVRYGLRYVSGGEVKLERYTGSNWLGSSVYILGTLGCFFS
jgi:hypothetical protein